MQTNVKVGGQISIFQVCMVLFLLFWGEGREFANFWQKICAMYPRASVCLSGRGGGDEMIFSKIPFEHTVLLTGASQPSSVKPAESRLFKVFVTNSFPLVRKYENQPGCRDSADCWKASIIIHFSIIAYGQH